ncbi:hypothetical protein BDN70DRAFT_63359 [Pholiota conissans]|uniref:Uncharacterized protein n=1 Tax=Pholiota conissans TaxID=109636 RepID=A0A9P5YYK6_9AGAR|nr:hypothetical protein BDN70DRAFT_63359 [Pholiota conissans]
MPSFSPLFTVCLLHSFWQNKGAVAATFVIVSLVLLAIAAVVLIRYLKRRGARRREMLHELFEKFPESGRNSPGPSINSPPMDAFAARDVDYSNPFHHYDDVEIQQIAQPSMPVQHPDYYYNQPATIPARYISPPEVQAGRKSTAPTSFRSPVGRTPVARESYQQSIDSFYGGAAGQPSASGYAL